MPAFGPLALMLVSRRERVSGVVTAITLFLFAALTAGPPHHRIVDGHVVAELVFLGRIVPKWISSPWASRSSPAPGTASTGF